VSEEQSLYLKTNKPLTLQLMLSAHLNESKQNTHGSVSK